MSLAPDPRNDSISYPLVDIGANLTHDSFDADRESVVAEARKVGVRQLIVTGASVTGSVRAIEIAAADAQLYATVGVHPHSAQEFGAGTAAALTKLTKNDRVVAVGECGLDYFRNFSPPAAQRAAFEAQLDIAAATRLPVFLHQRDAHADFLAMLSERRDDLVGGVAHCFTGGAEELYAYLDLDLYIGITGWICDERRGKHLLAIVKEIPKDRLLVETDAPYLLPRSLEPRPKSRRNEPKYLPEIVRVIAENRAETEAELRAATTANARRLFGLATPA